MPRNLVIAFSALAFGALSQPAPAGQKISFDGIQYYAAHLKNTQLEPGHTYSLLEEWRGIHSSKDAANPANRTRLECTGYFDARADGSFSAEGYCSHWDLDGDLWVGHWWNNSKMPVGRYEMFAGEGKYAGASGGGTAI